MAKKTGIKLIANNKKAFHDYFIEDTYEAGISLAGDRSEVPAHGKVQYKRILHPCGKGRGVDLWHAYQSL